MKKFNFFMNLAALAVIFLMTANSYSQWTFQGGVTVPGSSPSISVYSPTGVVVCGGASGQPKVYKSTNSGVTFTDISGNLAGPELWCVWAVDANTIYGGDGGANGGAGGNAKVWKTTNGGTLWTVILSTGGNAGFINSIVFSRTSPLVGIVQSDPPTGTGGVYWVQKTTDGGTTWVLSNPPGVTGQATAQNGAAIVDAQFYGYGLGNNPPARIQLTTNGGTAWSTKSLAPLVGGFVSALAIKSDKLTLLAATGDAAGSLPNIARSSDGGNTWSVINTGSGMGIGLACIKFAYGTNTAYLTGAGTGTAARKTTDGGLTWTNQTTQGLTGLTHMDLVYDGGTGTVTAYAVATDGSVLRLIDNLTGIDPNNTTVPTKFALQQNYPNPFNPTTNIKYSVPTNSNVTIKIYNTLGKEVMTVVNKYHTAGNYVENVDMSGLGSGVYFYTLTAGDFKDTKKMMLVK